jgi:hypothetical protein
MDEVQTVRDGVIVVNDLTLVIGDSDKAFDGAPDELVV